MTNNNLIINNSEQDFFNPAINSFQEKHNYDSAVGKSFNNQQPAISSQEIIFIDSAVADYQTLIDNLIEPIDVILLDGQRDGIIQITESLQQYQDLTAIHIVSHGDMGELSLGDSLLNHSSLNSYQDSLTRWRDSMTELGDILLYGCNVAGNPDGEEFVESLSQYTAADILASKDLTGSANLGGDWDLEYAVGEIESEIIFEEDLAFSYEQVLFDFDFNFRDDDNDIQNRFLTGNYGTYSFYSGGSLNRFESNLDNFNFDSQNIGLYYPTSGLEFASTFSFSNPEFNSRLLDFSPTKVNFNATDFDFSSLSLATNSISFQFEPAKFNAIAAQLNLFTRVDSPSEFKLEFADYNFDFDSLFSFESDQVTIGTTSSNTITFDYEPGSFNFTGGELFRANANLFEYKFLDGEISLINGDIPFVEYNASDFRALEYAFVGDELFDPEYYLATNAISGDSNPFTHYIENGYLAGRNPNALFDVDYYIEQNPDVRIAGIDPLTHYAKFGYAENHLNRDPNSVFDTSYYNQNNPDVVAADISGLLHYITFGNGENLESRDPNSAFDNSYYNQLNPDVAQSGMTALEHYLEFGWKESRPGEHNYNPNRNPNAFLNSTDYFILNNDVLIASYQLDSANPLQHWLEFGFSENRLTHRIFDSPNVLKFTKTITPKSNPQDISELTQAFRNEGYSLSINNGSSFEIRELDSGNDSSSTATAILSTTFIGGTPSLENSIDSNEFDLQFNFNENSNNFPQSSTLDLLHK